MQMDLIPKNYFFRDFFDDFFDLPSLRPREMIRSDIYEDGDNYVVEMDVPGFYREDIVVDYSNGYLNIIAKKESKVEDDKNYIRRERYYGEYKRSFYLGDIDESLIKATFKNGILKVAFPKKQAEDTAKKVIEIE